MSEITESLPRWPGVQKTNENVVDRFKKKKKNLKWCLLQY